MAFEPIEEFDEVDRKILKIIKDHARMSYSDIAERVGISRVAVKNHIEQMETAGIIMGYETKVSFAKDPEGIQFIMDIETYPEDLQKVIHRIASMKSFRQVYQMTGECRLTAIGIAPNQKSLSRFVDTLYAEMKGIKRATCHVVLSTIKDVDGGIDYVSKDGKHFRTGE